MSSRALSVFFLVLSFLLGELTSAYCRSHCDGAVEGGGGDNQPNIRDIISKETFEEMLPQRDNPLCPAKGFYKYEDFLKAAEFFTGFGTSGSETFRKRDVAAFFGQTGHETNGGAKDSSDRYNWGYCYNEEVNPDPSKIPYQGRGPMQITGWENYERCGQAIGLGSALVDNPDLLVQNGTLSFMSAIWFWMAKHGESQPSCHDVMIDEWTPTLCDIKAHRYPGYGVTTNIINGVIECNGADDFNENDRVQYYKHYAEILETTPGDNLSCHDQIPFNRNALRALA